ncbi:MAG: hypothetical protein H0X24_01645 [Ktedonobacterales bacterium]|nr:hypothetical protein [Ktedonobacterales bacterium]
MTQDPPEQTGLSKILGGFQRFSGGIEARPAEIVEADHVVSQEPVTMTVTHINGELPGEIAGYDFWVPLAQLQLAPPEDLLNSRYDHKADSEFEEYTKALDSLGDRIPVLPVLPANRDITLPDGTTKPLYLIYDMPYVYYGLIDLKRTRARVYIPQVQHPGAILLSAMGREGQLRREPTIVEICRAARRLKEYYGYTVDEICEQQAMIREDRTKPSITVVHYQIIIAGLTERVLDLLDRKQILWTHARTMAETFPGDPVLCEQLAILASQGKRMTADEFAVVVKRVRDRLSRVEIDEAGVAHEIPLNQPLKLVAAAVDKTQGRIPDTVTYDRTMVARPALIQREASRFTIIVVPADKPDQVAIAPASFKELREWLAERHTNTPVRETEAILLGFLQAIRQSARAEGILNAQGTIAPQIDAVPRESTAS